MILKSPDPLQRIVEDYEFTFQGGHILPLTIDKALGDTVSFTSVPVGIEIKIAAKPSFADPSKMTMPEEVTILYNHLLAITKHYRAVSDLTVEQQMEWKESMKAFANPSPYKM